MCARECVPGLQFLFCLHNSCTGGDSIFVDGYAVAEQLRSESPGDFEVLATVAVPFRHSQPGFRSPLSRPGPGAGRGRQPRDAALHQVAAQPDGRRHRHHQGILRRLSNTSSVWPTPPATSSTCGCARGRWPASTTAACCTAAPPSTPPADAAGCAAAAGRVGVPPAHAGPGRADAARRAA